MSFLVEKYDPALIEDYEIMVKGIKPSGFFFIPLIAVLIVAGLSYFLQPLLIVAALSSIIILSFYGLCYILCSTESRQEMRNDLRPFSRKRVGFIEDWDKPLQVGGSHNITEYREKLAEYLDAFRDGEPRNSEVETYLYELSKEASLLDKAIAKSKIRDLTTIIDPDRLAAMRESRKIIEELT